MQTDKPREPGQSANGTAVTIVKTALPILPIIVLGILAALQVADPTIASVALVKTASSLDFSKGMQAFAASVSSLALAASVIPMGSLSDKIGRRKVLMFSLVLTIVGDILAAAAPATALFLGGRALAGVGLGGVFACSYALIAYIVPTKAVGAALGLWAAISATVCLAMGLVGSALIDVNWRLSFLVIPFFAFIMLLVVPAVLPETEKRKQRGNPPALVALAVSMVGVLYGVSQLSMSATAPGTWIPILIGVGAFGLWILLESKSSHPSFPVKLLLKGMFVAAILAGIGWNAAQGIMVLQLSNLWQYINGMQAFGVTLGLLPLTVIAVFASVVVGKMLSKGVHPSKLMVIGLLVIAISFFGLLPVGLHTSYWMFLPALALSAIGLMMVQIPQARLFISEAPPEYVGAVTSSRTTFGQLGYAFGMAMSTTILAATSNVAFPKELRNAGVNPMRAGTAMTDVRTYAELKNSSDTSAARQVIGVSAHAYVQGFRGVMLVLGITFIVLAVGVGLLARTRRKPVAATTAATTDTQSAAAA